MVFKKKDDDFARKMFSGSWKCSQCGKEITELPFEPTGDLPIYCRDCHRERRGQMGGNRGGGFQGGFQRRMVQGNWKCAGCGAEITELPFEPRADQEIYCRDCYRSRRG